MVLGFVGAGTVRSVGGNVIASVSPLVVKSVFLVLSGFPMGTIISMLRSAKVGPMLSRMYNTAFSVDTLVTIVNVDCDCTGLRGRRPLGYKVVSLTAFLVLVPSSVAARNKRIIDKVVGGA